MGLEAEGAAIRLQFGDRVLRVECTDGKGGMRDRGVSVEFGSWAPRVSYRWEQHS
jgi:hypothetical protein